MIRKAWIVTWGLLLGGGFYELLIDTSSSPELYVLIGVAALCAAAFLISREQGFIEGRLRLRWLAGAWRVLASILPDIGTLCSEAVRQAIRPRPARGAFRAVRFRATEQTPEDTARRALTECFGSVSPNTIVVGVDSERGLLLVHQLRAKGGPEEVDPMGLG